MGTPFTVASQALSYVLPSQPQTGLSTSEQVSGFCLQKPMTFDVRHAPFVIEQYSPVSHSLDVVQSD